MCCINTTSHGDWSFYYFTDIKTLYSTVQPWQKQIFDFTGKQSFSPVKIFLNQVVINQAVIHVKHSDRQIVSFTTACQILRMTLIRLLPLVSTVIENHLQFALDIEIARGMSEHFVWCDDHADPCSRKDWGSWAWLGEIICRISRRESTDALMGGLYLNQEHRWGCSFTTMHSLR